MPRRCRVSRIRRRYRCSHGVEGKSVIYSTTNGTVAMRRQAAGFARLLRSAAQCARAHRAHPGASRDTVLIVCSGSGNNFNFEDFYGAGYFVECFLESAHDGLRTPPRQR